MRSSYITYLTTILIVFTVSNTAAQEDYFSSAPKQDTSYPCSNFYLGVSSGINNNSGIIGLNIEFPVANDFTMGTGIGTGIWGVKIYGEGKYYFRNTCHRGFAVAMAFTHSRGTRYFELTEELDNGTMQTVYLDLRPQSNLAFKGYKYWRLGKHSRFYLSGGYSVELTNEKYSVLEGPNPSFILDRVLDLMAPGGFILTFGFSFGL